VRQTPVEREDDIPQNGYADGFCGPFVLLPGSTKELELSVIQTAHDTSYAELLHASHVCMKVTAHAAAAFDGTLQAD
jgi:hypothetical protein